MRQFRELNRFLLYFFLGIIGGTLAANWLGGWLGRIPGVVGHYLSYRQSLAVQTWEIRLWQLAPQRLVIPLLLWLVRKHAGAKSIFTALTAAAGLGLSGMITWLTCLYGWRGIIVFFLLTLPQWFGYAPVWCVLVWGNPGKNQAFENRERIYLTVWYLAGLLGEVIFNPLLINFI